GTTNPMIDQLAEMKTFRIGPSAGPGNAFEQRYDVGRGGSNVDPKGTRDFGLASDPGCGCQPVCRRRFPGRLAGSNRVDELAVRLPNKNVTWLGRDRFERSQDAVDTLGLGFEGVAEFTCHCDGDAVEADVCCQSRECVC